MGWYLRKGFNFRPLRVNLSKSGLGYSFGVKGARIGVGPRGNYIHLGRGGIYYRQNLSPGNSSSNSYAQPVPVEPIFAGTPIQTAQITTLASASAADELLAEIQHKNSLIRFAPITTTLISVLYLAFLFSSVPDYLKILPLPFLIAAHWLMSRFDTARKLVVLNYHLDATAEKAYSDLLSGLRSLGQSARIWRLTTRDAVLDRKYQAGASELVSRKAISLSGRPFRYLHLNVPTERLDLGDQTLMFLPDRMLLYQSDTVAAIAYPELIVQAAQTVFIESEGVPSDSQIVGSTWRYVNKGGGPDRRFANNAEIPKVLYGEISLSTKSGVNFVLQASNPSRCEPFRQALQTYAKAQLNTADAPTHDEPVPDIASPDPANRLGSEKGWILAPVLAGALLSALLAFPPQETTPAATVTPPQPPPITIPARYATNCPRFDVIKAKPGLAVAVLVSQQTSTVQLQSLLWHIRKSISEKKLTNSAGQPTTDLSWDNGTILVYRDKRYIQESRLSPPPKKTHYIAIYRWSHNGTTLVDSGIVLDKGQTVRVF